MTSSLELGVIGNGAIAALIDRNATMVWGCFPRLDGDPVFCRLLDDRDDPAAGGYFSIELQGAVNCHQEYIRNSAVLVTRISDAEGNAILVTDFAPRFERFDRMFRPPTVVRRIERAGGAPRIRIRLRPRFDNGALSPQITRGSNHVRYVAPSQVLRLTTDAPASYIIEETPFFLTQPVNLVFGADESLTSGVDETTRSLLDRTLDYWRDWVRSLSLPFEWQEEVIRAAITLKLCSFEETGAIVAALTTSVPEAHGSSRNWDYRYCWLRDAYFVIHALNRLGTTKTMEDYITFIANIVGAAGDDGLRPVYPITLMTSLDEHTAPALAGYRGFGPVRIGNQAYEQIQNDVYGAIILASTHIFFDQRLIRGGSPDLFERLEMLGNRAVAVHARPDAGPWELRTKASIHTFSVVMCWTACDRLAKIATHLGFAGRAQNWRRQADEIRALIIRNAWSEERQSFVASFGGNELDATLLLLHELDFVTADDPRFVATVEAIGRELRQGDFLYRYVVPDDFGQPETAFTICTFWYIDALAAIGRRDEARQLFEKMLGRRNHLGLLSEDIDFTTGELWGNFPQTYSMVGLINSAMRLSKSWEEAF